MVQRLKAFVLRPGFLLVVYIALALIAAVQLIALGSHVFAMPKSPSEDIMQHQEILNLYIGKHMTDYNNYVIFKYSFFHLLDGKNLYGIYPDEHWDLFKYSPTFAFLMGLLAYLPDIVGLSIWDLLNTLTLFLAIRMLPFSAKTQCLLMLFIGLELLTSLQNAQSNGLMCGLMIAAYGCMERQKAVWATLWLVIATFIKIYGAIGFCLFLFYPDKVKFVLYALFWTMVLAAMPLLVTPLSALIWQYHNWATLLAADASATYGISVAGWLRSWFGISNGRTYVTLVGAVLFLIPLLRYKLYGNAVYRLLILASMLIWVIIFNHKAESPTYIIAVAGVGIWYFTMPAAAWRTTLFWTVFVFTSLGTTDLFPPFIKNSFLIPYTIKAFPCIMVWCMVTVELLLMNARAQLPLAGKRIIADDNIALN